MRIKVSVDFGKDNYFLELQDHGIPEQQTVNMALLQMSRELDIPLVCTNDVHYTYAEDAKPHDILLCIQTGKKLSDENRMRYEGGQYFVKSEEEMKGLFPYAWEAVEIHSELQTAVMWKSSLVRRSCRILMCRRAMIPGDI